MRSTHPHPLRVLEVSPYAPPHLGGVEKVVHKLCERLIENGCDVSWCAEGGDGNVMGTAYEPMVGWTLSRWGIRMRFWTSASMRAAAARVRSCDVVHVHEYAHAGSVMLFLWAKLLGKRTVVTVHSTEKRSDAAPMMQWAAKSYRWFCARAILGTADAVTAVGKTVAESVAPLWKGTMVVVPNGVDTDVFTRVDDGVRRGLRTELGWPESGAACLFVGRFTEEKGLPMLRKIAAANPEWSFVLLGEGPIDPLSWGLGNVAVAKKLDRETDIARYYQAADAFVFPAVAEGLSLVLLEALSCGIPCVAYDNVAREFDWGKDGILALPKGSDAAAWSEGIRTALARGRNLADTASHSWKKMGDDYLRLLVGNPDASHAAAPGPYSHRRAMRFSFVIPAHNEEKRIVDCLKSILDLKDPAVHQIIVVDNASTDRTAEIASSFPGVTVVREEKKGVTFARQRGLEEATGDLYAAVDADSRISRKWMEKAKERFGSDPGLICLVGAYDYYDLAPWKKWTKTALERLFATARSLLRKRYLIGCGGNSVYSVEALRKIGGFSTDMSFYGEDLDVVQRLDAVGTVKHDRSFVSQTSARRLNAEGFFTILLVNKANAIWQSMVRKPLMHREERDWR